MVPASPLQDQSKGSVVAPPRLVQPKEHAIFFDHLATRTDATFELVDLRDVSLPFFDSPPRQFMGVSFPKLNIGPGTLDTSSHT
jgi:hypothetical protein